MKEELIRLLKSEGCIKFGDFILSSGKRSNYYVDIKKAISNPKILKIIGKMIAEKIEDEKVAGIELGSVPIATAVSLYAEKPLIIIRKKPKDYGTKSKIEGHVEKGDKVVIVEDVTTTGNSVLKAVKELRNAGAIVEKVFVVVDRNEGAKENLKKEGVELIPLITVEELYDKQKNNI
ncbi:orotate phosphoribosyltransferase [Methanocaldococcus villosus KIN24-T80]|uniref:Orotate phosphoribosyltransferase n=1 Tax=Methanocaldococcus villosus KIN24-T80 TaxID=1069083 RepID=N6VR54_9EURY|nr:orotate phosphoribosyltransferase [Methanocaldococcus villosus]ENN96390.1 orotate phosphoribosyltransferase [Methanocaldococcus villosus KIN24-T80]